jgi:NADH-quinone oxidoreductase subunit N
MYFKVGVELYLETPVQYKVVLVLSLAITLFLGVYPAVILNLI